MTEEIKEILDDYKKLAGEITEKLDNTAEYESWLIIQNYVDDFLNYITNLQKENEKLKDTIKKDNHLLGCNFSKKDKYKQERDIFKSRNEKAIEYIEKYLHEHVIDDLPDEESKFELENGTPIPNAKEILLNILKGED